RQSRRDYARAGRGGARDSFFARVHGAEAQPSGVGQAGEGIPSHPRRTAFPERAGWPVPLGAHREAERQREASAHPIDGDAKRGGGFMAETGGPRKEVRKSATLAPPAQTFASLFSAGGGRTG